MLLDRVVETTTVTGTGTMDLLGAATIDGVLMRRFSVVAGSGKKVRYLIVDTTGANWECGEGVVTAGSPDTLTRATILSSSNSNAAVNFSAGTKTVYSAAVGNSVRFGAQEMPTLGGTANARTMVNSAPLPALAQGMVFWAINGAAANSGAATLAIDSITAKNVLTPSGAALVGGEMPASALLAFIYDGTAFRLALVQSVFVGDSGSGGKVGLVPAPAANDAAAGKILSADGTWKVHPGLRGYLAGLGLSRNGGTPNSKIDIAVGVCRDDTNAVDIVVGSTLTIDFGTTGANALDTGAKANSTWYHIYVIQKADGTKAGLGSTSLTPTMPSGYTYKRRLGSCRTDGSGNFLPFSQQGDEFLWTASILDVSANNPGTSAVSRTLTVPTGVRVWALFNIHFRNAGSGVSPLLLISALDRNDEVPAYNAAPIASTGIAINASGGSTDIGGGPYTCRTNTSAQVRSRVDGSDANVTIYLATLGWVDRRGRDD